MVPHSNACRHNWCRLPAPSEKSVITAVQTRQQASYEQIIGGRYALYGPIATGGMATVHFGRQLGAAGFARTVAVKRLRGEYLESHEFVSTLLDEARLASRIRHPNVVATLDMVTEDDELFLVMEYVAGESLSRLLARVARDRGRVAPRVATGILCGVLHALHAAHEATDERGEPLGIVHRDVSPQNVLVGSDGLARLLDFGIAKGKGRLQTTRAGQLKGKVGYMAPEQILGEEPDRRSDVYAASVVLWEVLTGRRLFPTSDKHGGQLQSDPQDPRGGYRPAEQRGEGAEASRRDRHAGAQPASGCALRHCARAGGGSRGQCGCRHASADRGVGRKCGADRASRSAQRWFVRSRRTPRDRIDAQRSVWPRQRSSVGSESGLQSSSDEDATEVGDEEEYAAERPG